MGNCFYMEDGIERSMSMLIQEAEQKKQTVQKPPDKTSQRPPQAAFQQVHPIGLSLPRDTSPLTNTNSGS